MYKKIYDGMQGKDSTTTILRKADGAFIPLKDGNSDYAEQLKWIAAGNTPEAADQTVSTSLN